MDVVHSLRFVLSHPLNRSNPGRAFARWCRWQVGSRLLPGAVTVPFVNGARLLVRPGMTGATGNVYTGLHEFEPMAFLLHLLRPDDLFLDVGANVGSYSILASGSIGAASIAYEPVPATFGHLQENVRLNALEGRVTARNVGVGQETGFLQFYADRDTTNRVVSGPVGGAVSTTVKVVRLDDEPGAGAPRLVKIDVEGFETAVIRGAERMLGASTLDALIVELIGQGASYGFDEHALRRTLRDHDFRPCSYDPFRRTLELVEGNPGNAILVRNIDRVRERLGSAEPFHVLDHSI